MDIIHVILAVTILALSFLVFKKPVVEPVENDNNPQNLESLNEPKKAKKSKKKSAKKEKPVAAAVVEEEEEEEIEPEPVTPEVEEIEEPVVESASKKKKNKKKKNKNKEEEPKKAAEPVKKEVEKPAAKKLAPIEKDDDQWEQVDEATSPAPEPTKKQTSNIVPENAPKKPAQNNYLDSLPEEIRAAIYKTNNPAPANKKADNAKELDTNTSWNDINDVNSEPVVVNNAKVNKKSAAELTAPIKVEKKKVFVEHNIWAEMHEKIGNSGTKYAITGNIIGNWLNNRGDIKNFLHRNESLGSFLSENASCELTESSRSVFDCHNFYESKSFE